MTGRTARWGFLDPWWEILEDAVLIQHGGLMEESYESIILAPPKPDEDRVEVWSKRCEALILVSIVAVADPEAWKQMLRTRCRTEHLGSVDVVPHVALNIAISSNVPAYVVELLNGLFVSPMRGQHSTAFYATRMKILDEMTANPTIRRACERQAIPVGMSVMTRTRTADEMFAAPAKEIYVSQNRPNDSIADDEWCPFRL